MDPILVRVAVVAAIVVAVLAIAWLWRRGDGAVRAAGDARLHDEHLAAVGLDLSDAEAGAVLLGSPSCSPCDSVKQVLGEISDERRSFRWVYADAQDHLGLAEAHRILRVPTTLVVAPDGRVIARVSGVPRRDDLRRVLDGDLGVAA
jgi:thiol-disulfide isomerase/thioredoxin